MERQKREIQITGDGSPTIAIPELSLTYHSVRGAVQESGHVFIHAGLQEAFLQFPETTALSVFEMGFGTGLNALLTALGGAQCGRAIAYTAIEKYPLSPEETGLLTYTDHPGSAALFKQLHKAGWGETTLVQPGFSLYKIKGDLLDTALAGPFHVLYYDAFAPGAQPELWTENIFRKLLPLMAEGGVLTTYCSKSIVRKAMTDAGFTVKKIPGPPGKREMVQAFRPHRSKE